MRVTYFDTAQSTPAVAQAIDPQAGADDDRILKRIIVGKPTAGATIVVYSINNAVFGASTNIAFKYTYPTFGSGTPASDMINFTVEGGRQDGKNGLLLTGGGSFTTSSAMQVSFLWDNPDDD